jgi:hypothetical protein
MGDYKLEAQVTDAGVVMAHLTQNGKPAAVCAVPLHLWAEFVSCVGIVDAKLRADGLVQADLEAHRVPDEGASEWN